MMMMMMMMMIVILTLKFVCFRGFKFEMKNDLQYDNGSRSLSLSLYLTL